MILRVWHQAMSFSSSQSTWIRSLALGLVSLGLVLGLVDRPPPALAQRQAAPLDPALTIRVGRGQSGRDAQAMRELADAIGETGLQISILSGLGGIERARDLLYRPGVELAVLRSDLLAAPSFAGEMPSAGLRLRIVSHLYTDPIYLFARSPIREVRELDGLRVGVVLEDPDARLTAETLADLLGIRIDLVDIGKTLASSTSAGPQTSGGLPRADAILLVGAQLLPFQSQIEAAGGYALLPIAATPSLRRAFVPLEITGTAQLGGTVNGLGVAAMLATFNWSQRSDRFPRVQRFITSFYRSLTDLRSAHPRSVWPEVDLSLIPPAWQRFGAIDPARILAATEMRELAIVAPPRSYVQLDAVAVAPPPSAPDGTRASQDLGQRSPSQQPAPVAARAFDQDRATGIGASQGDRRAVVIAAIRRPPFTEPAGAEKNIATEILRQSLAAGLDDSTVEVALRWSTRAALIEVPGAEPAAEVVSFPWQRPRCDDPGGLTRAAAHLCDRGIFSAPLLRVVAGVHVKATRVAELDGRQAADPTGPIRLTACVPEDAETVIVPAEPLNAPQAPRLEMTTVQRPTLVHCIAAVETGEVDGFLATDLEARDVIGQLGVTESFEIYQPTLFMDSLHAVAPRDNEGAAELIRALDLGLERLKGNGAYAKILEALVVASWRPAR
ncbi:MAG: hypothetical protein ACFCUN_04765 [Hyphomicrobiaceae bacterium]